KRSSKIFSSRYFACLCCWFYVIFRRHIFPKTHQCVYVALILKDLLIMTLSDTAPHSEPEQQSISYTHERFKWYAIIVQSGAEKRAKTNLLDHIKRLNLENYFGQILMPIAMIDKIDASGKRKKIEQRMMP